MNNPTTYYAISPIGWGKGHSPAEAHEAHVTYAIEARPSWVEPKEWLQRLLAHDSQPTIYRAPKEATGFHFRGSTVCWSKDGEPLRPCEEDEVIYWLPFE